MSAIPNRKYIIECEWGDREQEGSCNVCQNRQDNKVLSVSLPPLTFRVCSNCAEMLVSKVCEAMIEGGPMPPPTLCR